MKKRMLIAASLMFVVGAAVGQTEDKLRCIGKPIDSVRVNFISLAEDFLDVTLVADKETLSFFKKKHIPWSLDEDVLVYQTHSYDTIDYLFGRIDTI